MVKSGLFAAILTLGLLTAVPLAAQAQVPVGYYVPRPIPVYTTPVYATPVYVAPVIVPVVAYSAPSPVYSAPAPAYYAPIPMAPAPVAVRESFHVGLFGAGHHHVHAYSPYGGSYHATTRVGPFGAVRVRERYGR